MMSEILDGNPYEYIEKILWEDMRATLKDTMRAVAVYESLNMTDADAGRRALEMAGSSDRIHGYAISTLRRIVYCWRENIDFYEDLVLWQAKRARE